MKKSIVRMVFAACFGAVLLTGCERMPVSPDESTGPSGRSHGVSILNEGDFEAQFTILLDSLNLSAGQLAAIDSLERVKADCIEATRGGDSTPGRSGWAKDFAAQRKAVQDAVRAGTMTRMEARAELKLVAEAQSSEKGGKGDKAGRDSVKAAKKACRDAYYAGIYALLTDEQKVTWDAWMAIHLSDDGDTGEDADGGDDSDDSDGTDDGDDSDDTDDGDDDGNGGGKDKDKDNNGKRNWGNSVEHRQDLDKK